MNSKLENHVRKSYNSPQLVRYGGIRDLTKTGNGSYLDCNNTPPDANCDYNAGVNSNRSNLDGIPGN